MFTTRNAIHRKMRKVLQNKRQCFHKQDKNTTENEKNGKEKRKKKQPNNFINHKTEANFILGHYKKNQKNY